jgi:hypothetical protein
MFVLIHTELCQVCKYSVEHEDFKNLGVVSYIPPLPEHHEETGS